MERFDTDLWKFLRGKTEKSLGICERLKLAQKFIEKIEEIKSKKNVVHRDLKPQNVLLNLKSDGEWNGEMEITDFGIAISGDGDNINAGTSGWAEQRWLFCGISHPTKKNPNSMGKKSHGIFSKSLG